MADKPRVKAPKQRAGTSDEGARRKRTFALIAGVGVLVLAVAVVAVALGKVGGGGRTTDVAAVRSKLEAAGCTLQVKKAQEAKHSLGADDTFPWNTDPPTTGPHFGFNPDGSLGTVVWGAYTEPVQLARLVHNLEHGGSYILYGDGVPASVVEQLTSFYDGHKNGTVLAPLAKLGDKIALGAWVVDGSNADGYLAKCSSFDEAAYRAFFQTLQFKGPERIPGTSLLPGGN